MSVGTLLHAPTEYEYFKYSVYSCSILSGITGAVVESAPGYISAAWFPSNEKTNSNGN